MIFVVLLVLLNMMIMAMGYLGMGFQTPENLPWSGPPMPGKLYALSDPALARVVGQKGDAVVAKVAVAPPPVMKVEPQPVKPPEPPPSPPVDEGKFVVQVGSFALNMGAESLIEKLKGEGFLPWVEVVQDRVSLNNVQAGPFKQLEEAKEAEVKLKAGGLQAQVEENWEGYIISLNKSLFLGNAFAEMERARGLGVEILRMVKVEVSLAVNKVFLGPYKTKEKANQMSAKVAELGFSVPVLKTWPLTNDLP